jgi:6-phosphofructokinase 1
MLSVNNGFEGLAEGEVKEMVWTSVSGWVSAGGSMLGTSRKVPKGKDMYAIARAIEDHHIDAMLVIGGWNAYEGIHAMYQERTNFRLLIFRLSACRPPLTITCQALNSASALIPP